MTSLSARFFILIISFLPVSLLSQKITGIEQRDGNNFALQIRLNVDSSFCFTRTYVPPAKKKKGKSKACTPSVSQSDSFCYFTGQAKKINDSACVLTLDDTYALFFQHHEYSNDRYYSFIKEGTDSMIIEYDSIRFDLPTHFRLIYSDSTDTTYQLNALRCPLCNEPYQCSGLCHTCSQSWICCDFIFPVNKQKLSQQQSVCFDIGLKYPCSDEPILFNVPQGCYPSFKNWEEAPYKSLLFIRGKNNCRLEVLDEWGDILGIYDPDRFSITLQSVQ